MGQEDTFPLFFAHDAKKQRESIVSMVSRAEDIDVPKTTNPNLNK
jgi:hypothetical protein